MTRQWENDSYVKAWRRSASSSFTPVHYCGRWSWLHIDRQPHRRDDDRKWKSEQVNDSPAITAPALGAPQTQRPCVNYSSRTPTPSGGWRRSKQFKKRGSGNWRGTGSSCAFNKSAERVTFLMAIWDKLHSLFCPGGFKMEVSECLVSEMMNLFMPGRSECQHIDTSTVYKTPSKASEVRAKAATIRRWEDWLPTIQLNGNYLENWTKTVQMIRFQVIKRYHFLVSSLLEYKSFGCGRTRHLRTSCWALGNTDIFHHFLTNN